MNGHDKEQITNHQCKLCEKSFSFRQNLNRHIQNVHKVEHKKSLPSVKCPLCDFASHTVTVLDDHLVKQHSIQLNAGEIIFDCVEGNYIFYYFLLFSPALINLENLKVT